VSDRDALNVLLNLGTHGKGGGRAVTPTTLVGTKVIRGGDLATIKQAIADQKDW